MGSFFSNILIENTGPIDNVKAIITKALDPMGFTLADDGDEADYAIHVYGSQSDRFLVIVSNSDSNDFADLAKRIAKVGKCRTIAVQCIDSDVLLLSLTKGSTFCTVCMGDAEAYGMDPEPFRAALWKELMGTDGWHALRAVMDEQNVFAEDALEPLSERIGFNYADSVRNFDDPGEPLMECAFKRKVMLPYYLPDDQPPAFKRAGQPFAANPIIASFVPSGGSGTGCEFYVVANRFDAHACELRQFKVKWDRLLDGEGRHTSAYRHEIQLEPERMAFADGRDGWIVRFPDFEILPGSNEKHPEFYSQKGLERYHQRFIVVSFLIEGDGFPEQTYGRPNFEEGPQGQMVDLCIVPLQNRDGASAMHIGVTRYNPEQYTGRPAQVT